MIRPPRCCATLAATAFLVASTLSVARAHSGAHPGTLQGLSLGAINAATAQCATCGNPAVSTTGIDLTRITEGGMAPRHFVRNGVGLSYTWIDFDTFRAGYFGSRVLTPIEREQQNIAKNYRLRLQMVSLDVSADLYNGTGVALTVPFGAVNSRTLDYPDGRTEYGLGDAELRVRQNLTALLIGETSRYTPQITVTAGVVAPTGPFVAANEDITTGTVSGDLDARYVSLGRGQWWYLAEVDIAGALSDRLGWFTSFGYRSAIKRYEADNGYAFRWGNERRLTFGATVQVLKRWLTLTLAGEWQQRDAAREWYDGDDDFSHFGTVAGTFTTFMPGVQTTLVDGVSLLAMARVPVTQQVEGVQVVPSTGLTVNVAWRFGLGDAPGDGPRAGPIKADDVVDARRKVAAARAPAIQPGDAPADPEVARLLVPGKINLVDYWAEWCAPCKKLGPQLEAYASGRDDVVLHKIDTTPWDTAKYAALMPAQPEMPVLDVFGTDGKLIRRVSGGACFDFAAVVPPAP
jgi:thiol-disulfide isomerase/thioredoxin